jgi:di/tricarboxylate transporter
MVATRCISPAEVGRAVDFRVLTVIAAAFGIGIAVENSGLAAALASGIIALTADVGPAAAILAIYVATTAVTEMVTNNAAAVLMLPVAIATADSLGIDPIALAVVVAVAASASFLSPIGYQTNLMVMAPGSYRFTDYYRAGLPISLIILFVTIAVVMIHWLP